MKTFDESNFDTEVLQSSQPVLVDFYAEWCRPCHALLPILEQFGQNRPDVKIGKINIDESQNLATAHQIVVVPTLLVFKNGEVAKRLVGLQSEVQLQEAVA